jgi:hypothetical protein
MSAFPSLTPSPTPNASVKRLYLIRHGETDANASGVLQGRTTNLPLSEKGRLQGAALGEKFKETPVELFVVSSLQVCSPFKSVCVWCFLVFCFVCLLGSTDVKEG